MPAPRRLTLPPPFDPHWLEAGDVGAQAQRLAPDHGAGTLVWGFRPGAAPGRLDFAVVLEPEDALHSARRAFAAGLVALVEALAAHCAPDRAIRLTPRGEVRLDGSRLGGLRLIAAPGAEDAVPDWLVLCAELIADRDHLAAPGDYPASISLAEQGFDDPPAIVESFAAHLMLAFDRWKHEGFGWIAAQVTGRLTEGRMEDAGWAHGPTRLSFAALTRDAPWRDHGGPIL
ncbi:MAG: biotin/lipoate--protein ligase family protein [Gemmobacter sp.]